MHRARHAGTRRRLRARHTSSAATGFWPSIPPRHTPTPARNACRAPRSASAPPFEDGGFDAVLSQLVIQALDDAPAAARELRRVAAQEE
jgi:hypothetical protein